MSLHQMLHKVSLLFNRIEKWMTCFVGSATRFVMEKFSLQGMNIFTKIASNAKVNYLKYFYLLLSLCLHKLNKINVL